MATNIISVQVPKEKPPLTVVGDVGGRIAIMVVSKLFLFFFSWIFYFILVINGSFLLIFAPLV